MQLIDKFNNKTELVGIFGHPLKHSFSPQIHNTSFEALGMNYIYLPFDIPASNLKSALKGAVALGIKGMNITLPHKEKIVEYLQDVSEEASVIGSVNTVVNENGVLHGYNTDVKGIIETLNDYKETIKETDVTIIGAGGAARSVVYSLIRHFKVNSINIINRTHQKAESLKEYFSTKMLFDNIKAYELVPPDLTDVFRNSKLIINTTSVGMYPEMDDAITSIEESFHKEQIVFDVIYNPLQTKLLKMAASKGAETISGLKMFVEQAAASFELWTNEKMPSDIIYSKLKEELINGKEGV